MNFFTPSKAFKTYYIKKQKYYYTGSLDKDTIIIPLYRANPKKSCPVLDKLMGEFAALGLTIFWYKNKTEGTYNEIQEYLATFKQSKIGAFLIKRIKDKIIIKRAMLFLLLFLYPSRWGYIVRRFKPKNTVQLAEEFRDFVKHFPDKYIITVSQSAGGIIASRAAAKENNIIKLIAFAYPFKHPDHAPEAYRTEHLVHFNKPLLIIQGHQDVYGGESVKKDYALSPCINFLFTNSDHDYEKISDQDYQKISSAARSFLATTF